MYAITGTLETLIYSIPVYHYPINPTQYNLIGSDVTFNYSTIITGARIDALPSVYMLAIPNDAILAYTRFGDPGAYALTGTAATLSPGKNLSLIHI